MSLVRTVATGVLWAIVMLAVRGAASAFYGNISGFMILLPAVILAALAAGRIAGLTALVVCLGGGWLVVDLAGPGSTQGPAINRIATVNFILVGLFVTVVGASLRRTLGRLDASLTALQASDARVDQTTDELRLISEQAPVMLWMSNASGKCTHLNRALREFWDTPDDLDAFDFPATLHEDDRDRIVGIMGAAISREESIEMEARYRRADGAYRILHTEARPRRDRDDRFIGMIGVNFDVTEARAADAALRESEERFRLMADTAPSPVWLTNEAGEVEFANAALVDFYGRPAEAFMGHVWKLSVHPDDMDDVAAAQAVARPLHKPYGFECRFQRFDGVWRWMRVSVNPRFEGAAPDRKGVFKGYVGMSFDITETREALDALARQESRQSFLLSLTDRLHDMVSSEDVMSEVERALGEVLGADRVGYGELDPSGGAISMSRDWTAGVASVQGEFSLEQLGADLIADLAEGRTISIADVHLDPRTVGDRAVFERLEARALIRVPLIRAGRLRAFLYVHSARPRDWTRAEVALVEEVAARTWIQVERTRAQVEVAESEARFRAIADTAPVHIWVTGQDGVRVFVNQAYVAFMGGDYESVRNADWRSYIHPDDQDRLVRESRAGEATLQPFSLEARYRNSEGDYRWLKSISRPRLGAGGELLGFVGVAFDVTEAKRAEDDLKRINELLEERVGEALAEKAKAEADLMHAQRMEAVGRLTGGVAHDFNNLLTVVIGALDMILRSPDDAPRRKKLGEAALAAARRGESLTHQLLAFSRRQALRPEAVDLNALIREGEPLLRRAVGEAVDFRLKLRRGGAQVSVDPAQFEAALLNLIVNARDAVGPRAGGRITIQTLSCEVEAGEVTELSPGPYVCITVTDNGSGMDAATMARVFEPFFTTKAVGKGTGLGLSQVYGFARQSGGGVRLSSKVGKGTEIRLYLPPLDPAETVAQDTPRPEVATIPSGQRLLLVEDDDSVAAVAMELLRGLGLEVMSAETGPEALDILSSLRFDVMLSDVVMPGGMTGIELARQCAERYPDMRILLTSGYAGDDVDEALTEAPWPFLRKPYSGEQLRQALGESLLAKD